MTYTRDEAWIAHQVMRLLNRELEDATAALLKRLDDVERRLDERLTLS
jgi:hypothetical protein